MQLGDRVRVIDAKSNRTLSVGMTGRVVDIVPVEKGGYVAVAWDNSKPEAVTRFLAQSRFEIIEEEADVGKMQELPAMAAL
jgi:hypothetical protein